MTRFDLRIHLGTAFALLVLVIGGVIGWVSYSRTATILQQSVGELANSTTVAIQSDLNYRQDQSVTVLNMLALQSDLVSDSLASRMANVKAYVVALETMPDSVSLYTGYPDGDFFLVRRLPNSAERARFNAPASAQYLVQSLDRKASGDVSLYLFLDRALNQISRRDNPRSLDFDPRTRPWYRAASERDGIIVTPPYTFFTSQLLGTTKALRIAEGAAVIGIDLRLDDISKLLARLRPTPGSQLVLLDFSRQMVVTDQSVGMLDMAAGGGGAAGNTGVTSPALEQLINSTVALDNLPTVETHRTFQVGGEAWQGRVIPFNQDRSEAVYLGVMIPEAEILANAHTLLRDQLGLIGILLAFGIGAGLWLSRSISRPLTRLLEATESVRRFDFDEAITVRSNIREVDDLAQHLGMMKATTRRFIEITARVSAEEDLDLLLPELLKSTQDAAQARCGVLYLADSTRSQLLPAVGCALDQPIPASQLSSYPVTAAPFGLDAAVGAGQVVTHPAEVEGLGDFQALGPFAGDTHSLAVPLLNRRHELVGALLLFGDQPYDRAHMRFVENLSGFAAVSLETRELLRAQKLLFDAFVQLIAGAIDAKSPHTGGHCARVPKLTRMLAQAACDATSGPYKRFSLDQKEWEAVDLAAWLHDCGKVTTPEFVVEKATRLETIHDRIHEIRTRFEVVKREQQAACWQRIAEGGDRAAELAQLARQWEQLDADFVFVADCNSGETFMSPERLQRLQAIAARSWPRTLDDRIGISEDELQRRMATPAAALPTREPLLADRPDHAIVRPQQPAFDPALGITMKVPELLYNRGELTNLSVTRGTLTEEERYKINEHIVQSLVMLSALPLPKHLLDVPRLAASHHERMDGRGYPRGVAGVEMEPVARMMAIADIFEALTASDRPYKPGKSLRQALQIMDGMCDDGHIDRELFLLFKETGIPMRYAQAHLSEQQRDLQEAAHDA